MGLESTQTQFLSGCNQLLAQRKFLVAGLDPGVAQFGSRLAAAVQPVHLVSVGQGTLISQRIMSDQGEGRVQGRHQKFTSASIQLWPDFSRETKRAQLKVKLQAGLRIRNHWVAKHSIMRSHHHRQLTNPSSGRELDSNLHPTEDGKQSAARKHCWQGLHCMILTNPTGCKCSMLVTYVK